VTLKSHMESRVLKNANFEPVVSDLILLVDGKITVLKMQTSAFSKAVLVIFTLAWRSTVSGRTSWRAILQFLMFSRRAFRFWSVIPATVPRSFERKVLRRHQEWCRIVQEYEGMFRCFIFSMAGSSPPILPLPHPPFHRSPLVSGGSRSGHRLQRCPEASKSSRPTDLPRCHPVIIEGILSTNLYELQGLHCLVMGWLGLGWRKKQLQYHGCDTKAPLPSYDTYANLKPDYIRGYIVRRMRWEEGNFDEVYSMILNEGKGWGRQGRMGQPPSSHSRASICLQSIEASKRIRGLSTTSNVKLWRLDHITLTK